MSDSFSDSDGYMVKHYEHLERRHQRKIAPLPVYHQLPPKRPPVNIVAEKIISDKNDDFMKVLTNFSIEELTELYDVVSPIISKGSHKKTTLSPMSAFLITLCHLKHNEDWRKIAVSFDINYSYAYKKVKEIISICHETLSERFIKWIGVSQRIQQYNQLYSVPLMQLFS